MNEFEHSLWPAFRVRQLSSTSHESGVELTRDLHKVFQAIESNLRSPVAGDACEALLFLAPLIEACYDAQVLASNDASLINISSSSTSNSTSVVASQQSAVSLTASSGAIENVNKPTRAASSALENCSSNVSSLTSIKENSAIKRRRLVRDERASNAHTLLAQHQQHRVTVDSCFLLVAELFRNGSNVNRHLLLHVFNVCERFLSFVVSADEVVNRVVSVVASNDPIAQSLSLDALACLRPLIAARADVRHRMLACVAAADRTVRAAALRAVERLADSATRFGDEAAPVLVALLADAAVDAAARTHAAHILRHMHRCDVRVIDAVRRALRLALEESNDDSLRATVLVSLAVLASRTLVDVPGQMQRSLDIALSDASDVHLWRVASRCARRLASRAPALLERDAVDSIANTLLAVSRSHRRPTVALGTLRSMLLGSMSSLWAASTLDATVAVCLQWLRESRSLVLCANSAVIVWHVARDRIDSDLAVLCVSAVARCALPDDVRRGSAALVALLRIVANAPAVSAPVALTHLMTAIANNLSGPLSRVRLLLRAAAFLACAHPDAALKQCGKQWISLLRAAATRASVGDAVLDALCAAVRRINVDANAQWQSELCATIGGSGFDAHVLYRMSRIAARHALYSVAAACIAQVQASPAAHALPHTHAPWLAVVAHVCGASVELFSAAQASCVARERTEQAIADAALGNALNKSQRVYDDALLVVEQLAASSPVGHSWAFQQQWLALRARNSALLGAVVACMAVGDSPRALGRMLANRFGGPLAEAAAEIDQLAATVRTQRTATRFGAIPNDDAEALHAYGTSIRLLSQLCAAASTDDTANRTRLRALSIRMAAAAAAAVGTSVRNSSSTGVAAWPQAAPLRGQFLCNRVLATLGGDDAPLSSSVLIREFFVALLGATPLATPALFFAAFRSQ
jgi:hypothetical protein